MKEPVDHCNKFITSFTQNSLKSNDLVLWKRIQTITMAHKKTAVRRFTKHKIAFFSRRRFKENVTDEQTALSGHQK